MRLLESIIERILLEESVSVDDINDAIDNHRRIIINYHSKGEDKNTGARVIEVYAYGLTKAGNPVIRCFQPYGDTTSRAPSWKFFRLDRISAWKPTKQTFTEPADVYYKGLGEFNPEGDETMSSVYKVAKFGDNDTNIPDNTPESRPKTKEEEKPTLYKTDTERSVQRIKQQSDNPINISDIKTKDGFRDFSKEEKPKPGPKTKEDEKPETKKDEKNETDKELERLEQNLSQDTPITLQDLNKKMKEEEPYDNAFATDNRLAASSYVNGDDVYEDMYKDIDKVNKRERKNTRASDRRWEKSSDTRNLHRKGSLNRAMQ